MIKEIFNFAFQIRDVAQPGSALAWGARGRWFESSRPDFSFVKDIHMLNKII